MSRDANGSAGIIGLRYYLMWLVNDLSLTELKLNEWRVFSHAFKEPFICMQGFLFLSFGGDNVWKMDLRVV